jgi:hypothetical protein
MSKNNRKLLRGEGADFRQKDAFCRKLKPPVEWGRMDLNTAG